MQLSNKEIDYQFLESLKQKLPRHDFGTSLPDARMVTDYSEFILSKDNKLTLYKLIKGKWYKIKELEET